MDRRNGWMDVKLSDGQADVRTRECFIKLILTIILPSKRMKVTVPFPRLLL